MNLQEMFNAAQAQKQSGGLPQEPLAKPSMQIVEPVDAPIPATDLTTMFKQAQIKKSLPQVAPVASVEQPSRFKQEFHAAIDTVKAMPEIVSEMGIGLISMVPGMIAHGGTAIGEKIAGATDAQAEERAAMAQAKVHEFIRNAMYLNPDTPPPSAGSQPVLNAVGKVTELPKKWIAKPVGKAYGIATGDKTAGLVAQDAVEALFWFAALPKFAEVGKYGMERAKTKLAGKPIKTTSKSIDSFADMVKRDRVTVPKEAGFSKMREDLQTGQSKAQSIAEARANLKTGVTREEAYTDPKLSEEIFGTRGKDDFLRQQELEARQAVYEQMFSEKEVNAFLDDIEGHLLKREAGLPQMTAEELGQKFEAFMGRKMESQRVEVEVLDKKGNTIEVSGNKKVPKPHEFTSDWERWQQAKQELLNNGIQPAPYDFMGEKAMISRQIPGDRTDLRFGIKAGRPWPKAETEPPVIEVVDVFTPQRVKLGKKTDMSLKRKMGLDKKKTKTVEEILPENPEPVVKSQPEKMVDMAVEIIETSKRKENSSFKNEPAVPSAAPEKPMPPRPPVRKVVQPPIEPAVAEIRASVQESNFALMKERLRVLKEQKKLSASAKAEGPTVEDLQVKEKPLSLEAKKSLQVMDDRIDLGQGKDFAEFNSSPFHESLYEDMRDPMEMIRDMNDLFDERGSVGNKDLSQKQADAMTRLSKDLQIIKRNAAQAGKDIAQYLTDLKIVDPEIAQLFQKHVESIYNDKDSKLTIKEKKIGKEGKPSDKLTEKPVDTFTSAEHIQRAEKFFQEAEKQEAQSKIKDIFAHLKTAKKALVNRNESVDRVLIHDRTKEAETANLAFHAVAGSGEAANFYWQPVWDKVFKPLNHGEKVVLNRVISAMSKISIAERKTGYSLGKNVSAKDFEVWLDKASEHTGLDQASLMKIRQAAEDIHGVFKDLLRMKYEEGALSDSAYMKMKDLTYSPTQWLHMMDALEYAKDNMDLSVHDVGPLGYEGFAALVSKEVSSKGGNMGPKHSGLRRLQEGSNGYTKMDIQEILASSIGITHNWLSHNKASKALGNYAEIQGHHGEVVRLIDPKSITYDKHGEIKSVDFGKPPKGWKHISWYEGGVKQSIEARDWFADQWKISGSDFRQQYGRVLRAIGHASGASIARYVFTGPGNPFFFVAGLPMDVISTYFNAMKKLPNGKYTSLYSKNPLKFSGQIISNMKIVGKDVAFRTGRFKDFMNEGGGFNALTQAGDKSPTAHGKVKEAIQKFNTTMSYMNVTGEYLIRLANREEYIKQGYSPFEATQMARSILDFNKGGEVIKTFDNFSPYLNVGVQSVDAFITSYNKNPAEFLQKMGMYAGVTASLYVASKLYNQEAMEWESEFKKNNYFVFPTGKSLTDARGNKLYVNGLLRKEPALQWWTTATELMMDVAMGDKVSFKRGLAALYHSVPIIDGALLGPGYAALQTYTTGVDNRTLERINQGKVESEEDWDPRTSQLWKDLAQLMGANPKKFKAATEQVLGKDRWFSQIVGGAYDELFRELPKEHQETMVARWLIEDQLGGKVLSLAKEPGKYYDLLDEKNEEMQALIVGQNTGVDSYSRQYFNNGKLTEDRQALIDFIKEQPVLDQERLNKRVEMFAQTQGLPRQNMFMLFGSAVDDRAKAVVYHEWYDQESPESKAEIRKGFGQLQEAGSPIVPSDDSKFWYYVELLRQGKDITKH